MAGKILVEIIVLIIPLLIFIAHRKFPGNKITPYLTLKLLADRKYPKAALRQAGTGYSLFALWIFLVIFVTTHFFLSFIERSSFLLAVLFFVSPLASAVSLVLGISYLLSGLFGRGDAIKPGLESMNEAQKELLPRYIRKIKIYNVINLSGLSLLILLIPMEESLGLAENGPVIFFNVSLLITFIMTLWRIRAYLVKSATVMDLSPNKVLSSTLSNPFGVFFVWIHSILIIKKFNQRKQG